MPNHERKTAAAPVRNALTLTMTETASRTKAPQVRNLPTLPENSSFLKQLTNCAPPLFRLSSAISRCRSRLMT